MSRSYWSATRINAANYCIMRYHLRYVLKEEPLRLSAYVKGSLLHSLIEHFWEKLGTGEEAAKKSSKKKYHDAESFAKYAKGKWHGIIIADEPAPNKITWNYKEEPYTVLNSISKVCHPLFKRLFQEGPPIFSELGFDFMANGFR